MAPHALTSRPHTPHPPIPANAGTGPSLSRKGRGAASSPLPSPASGRGSSERELVVQVGLGRRVQVRRARAKQWTARRERRFIEALAATDDVPLAARQVGMTAVSAYRHRLMRPDFAWAWRLAVWVDHAEMGTMWIETIACLLDGEPIPPDNPVQTIGVSDVIRLYQRSCRPRKRPSTGSG